MKAKRPIAPHSIFFQNLSNLLGKISQGFMKLPDGRTINIHEAFVTMTVPVSIAMRVADNELGDSHYDAVCNLEMMLIQDLEEEYGITVEMASDHHNPTIIHEPAEEEEADND